MTKIQSSSPIPQTSPSVAKNDKSLSVGHSQQYYLQAATSDNTRKAYRSAVIQFEKWGGRLPCSETIIIEYLIDRAVVLNPRTLDLHLSAIKQWHLAQGFHNPTQSLTVSKTIEGIRRVHGKPKKKAKALRLEHVATLLSFLLSKPESKKKKRDIALLLVAFFGAFRRSELVAINFEDLHWEPEGLKILLPTSKTDQLADGLYRALPNGQAPICPVMALKEWIKSASITAGPIFRAVNRWDQLSDSAMTPGAINLWLKSLALSCEFNFTPELSSHSFRRGLSTSAAREKIAFELIKKQGGWKSDATVWEYIEEGQEFTENASLQLMEKIAELFKK
jgi:integrase